MKKIKENMLYSIEEVAELLTVSDSNGVKVENIRYFIDRGNLRTIVIDDNEIVTGKAVLSFLYDLEEKQAEEKMNKQLLYYLTQE